MKTFLLTPNKREIIGHAGEVNEIAIAMNVTSWIEDAPDGVPGLMCIRPDTKRIPVTCAVTDGLLVAELPEECTRMPGMYSYSATWTQNGSIRFMRGYTTVLLSSELVGRGPDHGPRTPDWAREIFIQAEQIRSALDAALQLRDMADSAAASKSDAEAAAGRAETAMETAEQAMTAAVDAKDTLEGMRGALSALLKQDDGGYPLIPGTAEGWMEQGTLNLEYGTEMASNERIRLRSLIPVRDIGRFEADEGYQIYVLCYDAGRNFMGVWYHNELVINMGLWQQVVNVLKVPTDVAYVRPMMSKTDGGSITIAEARALKIWRYMNEAAFDAERPFGAQLQNSAEPYLEYGLAGFELLEPGAIDGTGADADGAQYTLNSRRTPGLWPINGAESIVSHMEWVHLASAYNYLYWYTSGGVFISRTGGRNTNTVMGKPPANAAYFRISLTSTTAGDITDENITDYVIKWRVINPNVRKKWYVLGDSISAGYYSLTKTMADEMGVTFFYESPVTAPDGDATGSLFDATLQHNYWGYANRWINKALVPLGTPGQGYFRTAFNGKNGLAMVQENDFADADLITVAWGFNDWHYNQARGNHDLIDAAEPYATAATDASRITTINQAIWYCLGVLIDKAPDAEIVVQTPLNAWAYGGDFASNWSINYAMSNSGTLAQIHDDIVYWADYYGLKVLDLTYNNSFVNRQNIKSAIIDGSHPSDETHKRLGRYVANTLTGVTDVRRTDVAGSMAEFKAYLGLT